MVREHKVDGVDAIVLVACCALIALLTGCGPTVGWEAGVYVHPISQVNEQKELKRYGNANANEFETAARR